MIGELLENGFQYTEVKSKHLYYFSLVFFRILFLQFFVSPCFFFVYLNYSRLYFNSFLSNVLLR